MFMQMLALVIYFYEIFNLEKNKSIKTNLQVIVQKRRP